VSGVFDVDLPREGLNRAKWEMEVARTGDPGVLCFGTADMDFRSPPAVVDALAEVVATGHFGYPFKRESYYEAIVDHFARRAGWNLEREWLRSSVGIYDSIHTLIDELTEPGDEIVFQTPVHHIFREIVQSNGRVPVENPLVPVDGTYRMDLDAQARADHRTTRNRDRSITRATTPQPNSITNDRDQPSGSVDRG